MSPKLESLFDRHFPSIVVGLCTVVGWVFILGMIYSNVGRRIEEGERSTQEIRVLMTKHIEVQVSSDKDTAARLARIEAGIEYLKERMATRVASNP